MGLLVTPGCFWLGSAGGSWLPAGDCLGLLGATGYYCGLLGTTVDSWVHLGLLGIPGDSWWRLWTTSDYCGLLVDSWGHLVLLGTHGESWGLLVTTLDYLGLLVTIWDYWGTTGDYC